LSVRKRKWTTGGGEVKEAWIVDYTANGKRHIETFKKKKDADAYAQQAGVDIRAGGRTRALTRKPDSPQLPGLLRAHSERPPPPRRRAA